MPVEINELQVNVSDNGTKTTVTTQESAIYVGDAVASPSTGGGGVTVHNDLTDRDATNAHPADAVAPDTTNFDGILSAADDDTQKALDTIDDIQHSDIGGLTDPNAHPASSIDPSTTNFDNKLSSTDDTVQKALDTLESYEQPVRECVVNQTISDIDPLHFVYPTTVYSSDCREVDLADADATGADVKKRNAIGITAEIISASGGKGYAVSGGPIEGTASKPVDTSGWAVGTELYCSTDGSGDPTTTKPDLSASQIRGFVVTVSHATLGRVYVRTRDLSWLGDVQSADTSNERTGFILNTSSRAVDSLGGVLTYSIDEGLREVTINAASGTFYFWNKNNLRTKGSSVTFSFPDTEGMHYFYFDPQGNEQDTTTFSDNYILGPDAYALAVYWDADNSKIILNGAIIETHGHQTPGSTHLWGHSRIGAGVYGDGLALTDLDTDQNGSLAAHAQWGVSSGVIQDEDLHNPSSTKASTDNYYVLYHSGLSANTRQYIKTGFPVPTDVDVGVGATGRPVYNSSPGGTYQLETVPNGYFVWYYTVGLGTSGETVHTRPGTAAYASKSAAEDALIPELTSLVNQITFAEKRPLGATLLECRDTYSNAVKARTVTLSDGSDYFDLRNFGTAGGGGGVSATSHEALSERDIYGAHPANSIRYNAPQTTVLSNGILNLTRNTEVVAAESGTTDDIDTINVPSAAMGDAYRTTLIADVGDTLNIRHGIDNIVTRDGNNVTLTEFAPVSLMWDPANSQLLVLTQVDGDEDAFHKSISSEFDALAEKVTPVGADILVIEDSASSNGKAKLLLSNLPHTDTDAIHDNVANEINAVASKATPIAADVLLIEDSADSWDKKKITVGDLGGGSYDANAIHDNEANEISAITEKSSPVGADLLLIEDSAASNVKKYVQISNLPTGSDTDAIHDNVADEINQVIAKATPIAADVLLIEDSANSWNKKKIALTDLLDTTDTDAIHDNVAAEINAITLKASPGASDLLLIEDQADSWNKKRVSIGTLPTGSDTDAIHDNVANEISAITEKLTPVSADLLLIEDSAASGVKKHVQVGNLPGGSGTDADAIHDNVADEINQVTSKATPVDADVLLIEDSANSWNKKKIALTDLLDTTDTDAIHDNVAGEINAVASKATPVDADVLLIEDSADTFNKKKIALTDLLDTTDPDALHDNVANEISAITLKGTPVSADLVLIEDSEASGVKKKVTVGSMGGGGTDADAIHDNVADEINQVADKTTPEFDDVLLTEDGGASWAKKKNILTDLVPGISEEFADWQGRDSDTTNHIYTVVHNVDKYVAVGGTTSYTSPDGKTWTDSGGSPFSIARGLVYGSSKYVAVDDTSSSSFAADTSTDGVTWTSRGTPDGRWNDLAYDGSTFVAVGYAVGLGGTYNCMTSSDGITWTGRNIGSNDMRSVAYGNGLFVAVGNDYLRTSDDGITWTTRTTPQIDFTSVTWSEEIGLFVAAGSDFYSNDSVATSPDGTAWTERSEPSGYSWGHVFFDGRQFIVVENEGGSGNYITSIDGITWTAGVASELGDSSEVIYSDIDHQYVSVGLNGEVFTSGTSDVDPKAIHNDRSRELTKITEKSTPVSADLVVIEDSEDDYNKKTAQVGNLGGGGGGMSELGRASGTTQTTLSITFSAASHWFMVKGRAYGHASNASFLHFGVNTIPNPPTNYDNQAMYGTGTKANGVSSSDTASICPLAADMLAVFTAEVFGYNGVSPSIALVSVASYDGTTGSATERPEIFAVTIPVNPGSSGFTGCQLVSSNSASSLGTLNAMQYGEIVAYDLS